MQNPLRLAFEHHRQGRLAQAGLLSRSVLSEQPGHTIARAGVSRLKPSPRPPASPGQSGPFSVLRTDGSIQIPTINQLRFLDALLLPEGMQHPG
jgi:hypothetical protein